jgi:outer membrane protein TolC
MTGVSAAALLLAASLTALSQDAAPPVLTLADAVRSALQNNARVGDAAALVDEARVARTAARSAFRPRVVPTLLGALGGADAISNQRYGLDVLQRFRWGTEVQASVGTASSRNQLGTFYYSDTTLSITQPLLGAGSDPFTRAAAAADGQVQDAEAEQQAVARQVVVDVATAYYAVVAQQQVVVVAEKSLERARRLLEMSEAKLAIGKVSQLDTLRARQLAREAESRLLDARAAAEDAADQLRLVTGRTTADAFSVDARIPDVPFDAPSDAQAMAAAFSQRPELRRARREVEAAEREVAAARRPALPRVDFKLALTRRVTASSFQSSFGTDGFQVVPFIGLSAPLDGSGTARDAAQLTLDRRRRAVRALEQSLEMEARRAVRQHDRLLRSVEEADAAVDFAQQQVEIARVRFDRGLSNNLDLVSAEADLLAAESRRISTKAALAVAALGLKAALGTLDPTHDFKN